MPKYLSHKFCLHGKFYFSNLPYQQHQFFDLSNDIKMNFNEANYKALFPFVYEWGGRIQLA